MPTSAPELTAKVATATAEPACASCGSPLAGRYCAHCGQRLLTSRHTIRSMVLTVLDRVFNLEQGLLRTAVRLTVAPGQVVRDYLRGGTAPYTHPVAYILICFSALVLLSFGVSGGNENDRPFFGIVVLFIAAASRLVFWKAGLNFAEHLILDMFLLGQVSLFWAAMIVPVRIVTAIWGFEAVPAAAIFGILLITAVGYFAWGYSRFFDRRPAVGAIGAIAVLAIGTISWGVALIYFIGRFRDAAAG